VPDSGEVVGSAKDSLTDSESCSKFEVVTWSTHRRPEEAHQPAVLDVHVQRFLDHDKVAEIATASHARAVDTHSCDRGRLGHS
jgi:hypothetical protein